MHRATEGSACSEPSVTDSAASGAADSLETARVSLGPGQALGGTWMLLAAWREQLCSPGSCPAMVLHFRLGKLCWEVLGGLTQVSRVSAGSS